MRGTLKTSTLESKFPLLAVEGNCILSKFADVTAAFRVTLPELFTLTAEEYEAVIPCEQRTTIRYQVSEMSAF